jgi:Xaa-Pro aminopeptidase
MTSVHKDRIKKLRDVLHEQGLHGFIIPRSDEHLGEYVAKCSERLAFISGFTGSAGLAIVLPDRAVVFSDGRYALQLEAETDPDIWERHHITETPPETWLKEHATGLRIGYDPWLISAEGLKKLSESALVPVAANPVDKIWTDRPAPPAASALPHDIRYAGEGSAVKRLRLAEKLRNEGQDAALLVDPASAAWLFNLRGGDVEFTPVALSFAILHADASAILFIAAAKLPEETRLHLGHSVEVLDPECMPEVLARLRGKTMRYDPANTPVWFKTTLEAAGAKIAAGPDLVSLPRATKNDVEQRGARAAHVRDGLAMVRFLARFADAAPKGGETEISAAVQLLNFRQLSPLFKGESFPAISGAGEHGAIIHYRVTPETNRAIWPNEVYLIDSGAQYHDGTTDVTRTVWTGPSAAPQAIKDHATRVLAGHIALNTAVFPQGVTGLHLDALARGPLWQAGLDYDHGTGHGVGSYLSVHEGPAGISRTAKPVPLETGMILSNEPGFYLPGSYGIRLENLELVQPSNIERTGKKFLQFETLTLAPFDRALIDPTLLTPDALQWLNNYHSRVFQTIDPLLNEPSDATARHWLKLATAPI